MRKPKPIDHKYLTVLEAAKYLRLSKETIYRRLADRSIPHYRVGKKFLFTKDKLDEWIKEQSTAIN